MTGVSLSIEIVHAELWKTRTIIGFKLTFNDENIYLLSSFHFTPFVHSNGPYLSLLPNVITSDLTECHLKVKLYQAVVMSVHKKVKMPSDFLLRFIGSYQKQNSNNDG